MYADDLALIYQCETFEEAKMKLGEDLRTLNKYSLDWQLKLNPSKTEVSSIG